MRIKEVEKETLRKSSEIPFFTQLHWTEEYQKLRRHYHEMWRRTIYWVAANCREQPAVSTLYRHIDNSVCSSQTMVPTYQTTRCHIPKDQSTTDRTSLVINWVFFAVIETFCRGVWCATDKMRPKITGCGRYNVPWSHCMTSACESRGTNVCTIAKHSVKEVLLLKP
jgi:hypothetical protein